MENVGEYFSQDAEQGDADASDENAAVDGSGLETLDTTTETTSSDSFYRGTALASLGTGSELEEAIYWMYSNGLTKYDVVADYRPKDYVTREEAAKLIGKLFETLQFPVVESALDCHFVDEDLFDPTLADWITQVCTWGIFRGNDKTHAYMPHDTLTKGQILAVLTRMLEGKMSNEQSTPRWIEYYVKMKYLEVTNDTNLSRIDLPLTREQTALLIYRFKNLIINPDGSSNRELQLSKLKGDLNALLQQVQTTWDQQNPDEALCSSGATCQTGSVALGDGGLDLSLIAGNQALVDDPEFHEAVKWMYDKGITSYNEVLAFMPFETVTREQMAKMLSAFAEAVDLTTVRNESACTFSDVPESSAFFSAIHNVCLYGVMNGSNGKFNPRQTVSKAEFIAMLVRLVEGRALDESKTPRWVEYYQKAIDLSLISPQDTVTFSSPIARYEVAIFFYRLKTRLTMFLNLNDVHLPDEIVKTMEEVSAEGSSQKVAKVYVDVLALNNSAFKVGYFELFGTRYQIKKLSTTQFNVGDNSFVWYGELYDLASGERVGRVNFTLTNGSLTEGSFRFTSGESYYLSKDEVATTWFWVK